MHRTLLTAQGDAVESSLAWKISAKCAQVELQSGFVAGGLCARSTRTDRSPSWPRSRRRGMMAPGGGWRRRLLGCRRLHPSRSYAHQEQEGQGMKRPTIELIYHGVIGGILAGLVVVVWFLIVDSFAGQPFHTPATLAGAIFDHRPHVGTTVRLIAMYSVLHFARVRTPRCVRRLGRDDTAHRAPSAARRAVRDRGPGVVLLLRAGSERTGAFGSGPLAARDRCQSGVRHGPHGVPAPGVTGRSAARDWRRCGCTRLPAEA